MQNENDMNVKKIVGYLCDSSVVSSDDIKSIEDRRLHKSDFGSSFDELEAAMLIADAAIYDKFDEAQQSVWNRLESNIDKQKIHVERDGFYIGKKRLYGYIAAAVVAFALFGVGFWQLSNSSDEPRMMSVVADVGGVTANLFDGTSVTLNSNSTIEYSTEFDRSNRNIALCGEAWFDVAKSDVPFVVYSNNISVTALGTSFNVRSVDSSTVVTLNSGKVIVSDAITHDSLTILLPGQKAIIDSNMNVKVESCDALSEGIWRESILEFSGESLEEIIKTLEKWHGITIINRVKPNGKIYWMKMTEKRITTTLEVFKNLENIDYEIVGDTVILKNR